MPDIIKWGFALGIFALAVAFLFPAFITLPTDTADQTLSLDNGTETNLTDHLSVSVESLGNDSAGTKNATLAYENLDDLNTTRTTLNETENGSIQLSGDAITTTIENVTIQQGGPNSTRFEVTYPPLFGWDSGPRLFLEHMDVILALLAGLITVGLLVVRI